MMNSLCEKFYKAYCEHRGYDGGSAVIAGIDNALSIGYPVLVQKGCGHTIISVVKELAAAVDELLVLPENSDIDSVMEFLFDEGISYEKDVSYIGALDRESFKGVSIPNNIDIRLLDPSDKRALSKLNKTTSKQDQTLAQVSMKDEMLAGIFVGKDLVCAASTLKWGAIRDIGVITSPDHRKKGYAKLCVNFLMQKLFEMDENAIAQYRCDKVNEPSVNLMHALGFVPMMELNGAIMDFSGE